MKNWIPLWTSALDSTLWEEPPHVRVMFLTLLLARDKDHVVREPMRRLAKRANLSEDREEAYRLAVDAMGVLCAPDTRSVENQEFEGRRVKKLSDEEWLILNGEKYEDERKLLQARMRKAEWQRRNRGKPARQIVQEEIAPEVARDRRAVAKLPAPAPLPQAATVVDPEPATVPSLSRAAVKAEAERLRAQFQEQVEGQPGAQNGDDEEIPFGPEAGNPDNPEDYR